MYHEDKLDANIDEDPKLAAAAMSDAMADSVDEALQKDAAPRVGGSPTNVTGRDWRAGGSPDAVLKQDEDSDRPTE